MNIGTNYTATTPSNSEHGHLSADVKPGERLIAFAPKGQVPVQLEHWLRKRQIDLTVSESATAELNEIRHSTAKYVLLDLDAQGNDLGVIRTIRSEVPNVRLIVTTSATDPRFLDSVADAGASGVVIKRAYVADLALAVQAAGEGRNYLPGKSNVQDGSQVQITARERQVLELMANGYSNQAIGEKLSISVKTVEAHRARLFKKLGASNVADAVLLAIRVGLIMP